MNTQSLKEKIEQIRLKIAKAINQYVSDPLSIDVDQIIKSEVENLVKEEIYKAAKEKTRKYIRRALLGRTAPYKWANNRDRFDWIELVEKDLFEELDKEFIDQT